MDNCENCFYFQKRSGTYGSVNRCRRYPPVKVYTVGSLGWEQPEVSKTDFCGDYRYKGAEA